ncbi:hypothetical protein CMT41_16315 [Colwellia sp. MT41]|nr:hypothetical protein CMT41_16315 [Colwellia sp. MT41]
MASLVIGKALQLNLAELNLRLCSIILLSTWQLYDLIGSVAEVIKASFTNKTVYGYTLLDSAGAHCPDVCAEPHGWDYVQDERYIAVTDVTWM